MSNESFHKKSLEKGFSTVRWSCKETYKRTGQGFKGIYYVTKTAKGGIWKTNKIKMFKHHLRLICAVHNLTHSTWV